MEVEPEIEWLTVNARKNEGGYSKNKVQINIFVDYSAVIWTYYWNNTVWQF